MYDTSIMQIYFYHVLKKHLFICLPSLTAAVYCQTKKKNVENKKNLIAFYEVLTTLFNDIFVYCIITKMKRKATYEKEFLNDQIQFPILNIKNNFNINPDSSLPIYYFLFFITLTFTHV